MRHALPLLVVLLLAALPAAAAHAELDSSDPTPNGNAPAGLDEIRMQFTELLDPAGTRIEVIEARSGENFPVKNLSYVDGGYGVIAAVEPLADGIYTIKWRTLSQLDGHTWYGAFAISVGSERLGANAPPPSSFGDETSEGMGLLREGLVRAAYFGGLFLGLGIPLFALVVLRGEPIHNRLAGTGGSFALVGGIGGLVLVQLMAQRLDLSFASAAATAAGTTFLRRALLLCAAGLVLLGALWMRPERRRFAVGTAGVLAFAALLLTTAGSHAAAVRSQTWIAMATDGLHLLMASVWIGGVVAFLHVIWGRSTPDIARLIHRFSPLALASVVALLATGTYAGLLHIPRVSDLWLDPYGRMVAAKALLMLPLIMLGAYNNRFLVPRLLDGRAGPHQFRRALQLEVVAFVAIIVLAGTLTASAPPREDGATGSPSDFLPPEFQAFELDNSTRASHVIVRILPNPPTIGPSNITIIVHSGYVTNSTVVYATFEPEDAEPDRAAETIFFEQAGFGPGAGEFRKEDTFFTSAGTWKMHVTVQYGGGRPLEKLTFDIPVAPPGGASD